MTVNVRKKINKSGISIYLDTYVKVEKGIEKKFSRSTETLFSCVKNDELDFYMKLANKEAKSRLERFKYLNHSKCNDRNNISFIEYMMYYSSNYTNKDLNKVNAVIKKFTEFQDETGLFLTFNNISHNKIKEFAKFLYQKLNGETPRTYFKCFVRILKDFHSRSMIDISLLGIEKIKFSNKKNRKIKNILSPKEINKFKNVKTYFEQIKKAFLFACATGLGLSECRKLRWDMINEENVLIIKRSKNSEVINIKLNKETISLLGTRKDFGKVFDFSNSKKDGDLSDYSVNKRLKLLCLDAGISKHITFYCGRHTYANLIFDKGYNMNDGLKLFMVTKALGHSNINSSLSYLNNYYSKLYEITESIII